MKNFNAGEPTNFYTDLNFDGESNERTAFYVAGKTVMSELLGEKLEAAEIIEINENYIRRQKSISGICSTARINNTMDFPDFTKIELSKKRLHIEKAFLIVAGGVWAQSIFSAQDKNCEGQVIFEQIQSIAITAHVNTLLALRAVLKKLRFDDVFYEPEIYEELCLDYEAFLHRQSFTLIRQKSVWKAIVEIAAQLANKKTLNAWEIGRICYEQQNFKELRREITAFHSSDENIIR